ncbi:MAG: hypothetical protein AAFR35_15615 [Pseudomonadota bacterium]
MLTPLSTPTQADLRPAILPDAPRLDRPADTGVRPAGGAGLSPERIDPPDQAPRIAPAPPRPDRQARDLPAGPPPAFEITLLEQRRAEAAAPREPEPDLDAPSSSADPSTPPSAPPTETAPARASTPAVEPDPDFESVPTGTDVPSLRAEAGTAETRRIAEPPAERQVDVMR